MDIENNKTTAISRYATYKDSGVEWLGEIPAHWEVKRLKYVFAIYNGDSISDSKKDNYTNKSPQSRSYIGTKDIDANFLTINYDNGLYITNNDKTFKVAPKGSTLLCVEGGSAGKKIAYLEQTVSFGNKLACFRSISTINSKYYFYFIRSIIFQTQFSLSMTGMIGGVSISLIKNFFGFVPPPEEQTAIAQYLEVKCEKIDLAVRQKEQLIALLQERKQAMIQNAVTKGIRPKAPLKPSGIDWIGDIPEGWEIFANKTLFRETHLSGEEGLPLLSVSIHSAVSSEELSEENNIQGRVKIKDKSNYKLVEVNDIVFNMMRAWQGAIGVVKVKGMVSPAYIVASPNANINAVFFEYQYRTPIFIQEMSRFSKGITDFRKRLYWDEFKQIKTLVPPLSEQKEIVAHIETESAKIDRAIALQSEQIAKLQEYKASLINAVVTGKQKVVK